MRSPAVLVPALTGLLLLSGCSDGGGITVTPSDPCAAQSIGFPGNATGSVAQTECRVGGRPAAFHRFTVSAARSVEFAVEGDFAPEIAVLADRDSDHLFRHDGTNAVSGVWLLPAGEYLLRVVARSGTGAYSVAGTARAEGGCLPRLLVPFASATYTRQLAGDSCLNTEDGSLYETFVIYSTRPCTITMRSNQVDSFLFISNGRTGEVVAFDDDSGGGVTGLDARVTLPVCNSGGDVLEVYANTAFAGETGSYSLVVEVDGGPVS
jgi:hypothetical protein